MIWLIGYGNTMRSDDGVGIRVVNTLAESHVPNIRTVTVQQLHIEFLEDVQAKDVLVFVDAAQGGPEVDFRKVELREDGTPASSHHLTPELFLQLALAIYRKPLSAFVCSIRGESFELGETLTGAVESRARVAAGIIEDFVRKEHNGARSEIH